MESLKDRIRFKDVSWLMERGVDLRDALGKIGLRVEHQTGDEITSYCPDHSYYVGREPSHPKWTVNVKTGDTFCFTEGRGSNIVWTISRVLGCGLREAAEFLLGMSIDSALVDIAAAKAAASRIRLQQEEEKPAVKGLDAIAEEMSNRNISERTYQFFIHPPEKKYPTNILPETVDRYWVFERTWGFYSDRAIIPFVMEGYVVGFCALDLLGKQEWLRRHPTSTEKDYRKGRFPLNFVSGNFLFGYDDCEVGSDLLIVTEGPREVMKLWQEGFTNSVAILGSHMGDKQIELISSLAPQKIVLMFDGDEAGRTTTDRIADKLCTLFVGDRMKKCILPEGVDPKNLAREDFEQLIF